IADQQLRPHRDECPGRLRAGREQGIRDARRDNLRPRIRVCRDARGTVDGQGRPPARIHGRLGDSGRRRRHMRACAVAWELCAVLLRHRSDRHLHGVRAAVSVCGGRPLSQIARQPVFIVAALSAALGYGIMNLLMTATPLAMSFCSHPFSAAAFVIEWHVVGMYAPGFFTGSLIGRFGVLKVIAAGIVLMGACVAVALSGIALWQFWAALVLLGVGWNFMYIGGTT